MATFSIHELVPDPEAILALEPEELAGVILQHLNSLSDEARRKLDRRSFFQNGRVEDYPQKFHDEIKRALMEAWGWLEREGLLAPNPGSVGEYVFITRRGEKITTQEDLRKYRHANLLPRQQLHPRVAQKVWATFLRGDYDTAVFQAFKEVEVHVRDAGNFTNEQVGTDLMRQAFGVTSGPLTDTSEHKNEQQALSDLFAGAIGRYRNSTAHRHVTIEAQEAVETIVLASHLLGIVDKRAESLKPPKT